MPASLTAARRGLACWLLAAVSLAAGCSAKSPPPRQTAHIRGLWHVYLEFVKAHNGQAPKDAAELRAWAEANVKPERYQLMGITSLDDAFVSPRDNKPYVVRPVDKSQMHTAIPPDKPATAVRGAPVVAYEQQGQNGRRFVAYAFGEVGELPEAAFQRLLAPQ
jgi:hypothetical protein